MVSLTIPSEAKARSRVDGDGAGFVKGVGPVAAPLPIGRSENEAGGDGVHVDVVDLLFELLRAEHVEVVVAAFPDMLLKDAGSRKALLEDLNGGGDRVGLRLGEDEMEVCGHDYVSDYAEGIAETGLFEDGQEGVPGLGSGEERLLAEAVDVDGVEVTRIVVAAEARWHLGILIDGSAARRKSGRAS